MNTSILCILMLLVPVAGWSVDTSGCLTARTKSSSMLAPQEALAVVIDLPLDAKGPIASEDSGDYLWQTSKGDVRVLFNNDPRGWPHVAPLKSPPNQPIKFFRWKNYAEQDMLLGYQRISPSQNRSMIVEVPVDWSSCDSIRDAAQIVRSARLINDPSKLRVVSVEETESGFVATLINELGSKKTVREGDIVTRDAGRVKSISKDQVIVAEYVWGSGWRTVALKFGK